MMRKLITLSFLDTNELQIRMPLDEYEKRFRDRFVKGEVSDQEMVEQMKDFVEERDNSYEYDVQDFNHDEYRFCEESINE
tara:strand:- start:331 stop:570 length:240 start_codon:yes stop_codon:yes gene_type:complete